MKKIIITLTLLISCFLYGQSQCVLVSDGVECNGECTHNGNIGGQSFVACQSGSLEEIELGFTSGGPTKRFVLRFFEGEGYSNLIWTTDTFTITSPTNIYDLSTGTGTNFVDANMEYSFNIESVGSSLVFFYWDCTSSDTYIDGDRLNCDGNVIGTTFDINFRIAINEATLPVELYSFSAKARKTEIELSWITKSEINNQGFEIQHSTDAINWNAIGFMEAQEENTEEKAYEFIHQDVLNGYNYYRLKQIDNNGDFSYSSIQSIRMEKRNNDIQVFPNPFSNFITVSGVENSNQEYAITNTAGKLMQSGTISKERLDLSSVPSGLYFLRIEANDGTVLKRIVKD